MRAAAPALWGSHGGPDTKPRCLEGTEPLLAPSKTPGARWLLLYPGGRFPLHTCLLRPALDRGAPGSVPCSIEGRHSDHIGSITGQVLELHPILSQEKCLHSLGEVLPLGFPEINLWAKRIMGTREDEDMGLSS